MKVLILGNTGSSGYNLREELRKRGHTAHLISKGNPCLSGSQDKQKDILNKYDILHINAPSISLKNIIQFMKLISISKKVICNWHGTTLRGINYEEYKKGLKIICHWRGTDMRGVAYQDYKENRKNKKLLTPILFSYYKIKEYMAHKIFFKYADYHFYSTIDLAWWLRDISENKKSLLRCMVNTDIFKPSNPNRKGKVIFRSGARNYKKNKIKHDDMPEHLNKFKDAEVYPACGLSPYLVSVTSMECLACGLKVKHHPTKNRKWVIDNASIKVVTDQILKVYNEVLK